MAVRRLLIVTPQLQVGGAERQIVTLAREFSRLGVAVTVVSSGGALVEELPLSVRHITLPVHRKAAALHAEVRRSLTQLAAGSHFDVVHAHSPLTTVACRLAGARRLVSTVHGLRPRDYWLARHLLRWSGATVVSVSEATMSTLRGSFRGPSEGFASYVVPTCFDPERLGRGPERLPERQPAAGPSAAVRPLVVGSVGRLAAEKGYDVLLEAIASLVRGTPERPAYPELQVLLVGDGPKRQGLMAQAHQAGIADRLAMPGFKSDVASALRSMDLFVLPSRREGLPTAILEAMALGVPVVASRVGGIPEVIEDGKTGLLVPTEDPGALAEALDRLLRDDELRRRLASAAREKVVAEHHPAKVALEYLRIYEEIVGEDAEAARVPESVG